MENGVRVTTIRDIVKKELHIKKGTRGWAMMDRSVYKRKKPQPCMVYVLFDDGKECAVDWHLLMRNIEEKERSVIKYQKENKE